jgi:putative ABC transport system substrate-binding protein
MNRRVFAVFCVLSTVLLLTVSSEAQPANKFPRIGYLSTPSLSVNADRIEAFRQGLHELGYVEGKNIIIEWRSAEGKEDRLSTLAAELVRLKIDIIVSPGGRPTRVAREATSTIPIVMAQDNDPVGNGFVTSLARPGGNITGLSNFAQDLSGKRLEILREIIPKLSRVAILGTSTVPGNGRALREIELVAGTFGVKLQYLDVLDSKDIDTPIRAASKGRADGVITLTSGILFSQRARIADLAGKNRLPVMYNQSQFVEVGGLMFYGVNILDLDRRAATYVDKILKGAKPANLPVEQPTKFELIINLKAAKQIGLTIPQSVLYRADRVIK